MMSSTNKPQTAQPHSQELPESLALRVQALREQLDLTQRQLAKKAIVPLELIQDLESGLEVFLAPATRLKLSRALRIKPDVLEDVEKRPTAPKKDRDVKFLLEQIVAQPDEAYDCPDCDNALIIRQFDRLDLQDNPLVTIKVQCSQCLFRWTTD